MTVPNRLEKTPEAPSPSELNPLTNPILEQNIGRWAKVYFGNPPAMRDQAVSHLLEALKRESEATLGGRPYFATDAKFLRGVCSICQHQNPSGHKFCSRCGQVLAPAKTPAQQNPAATAIPEAPRPTSAEDMPWLREQTFASLGDSDVPRSRGWKYLAGAVVIALAGFAYMQWVPGARTKVATSNPPQMSAPAAMPPEATLTPEAKSPVETIGPKPVVPESQPRNASKPTPTTEANRHPV